MIRFVVLPLVLLLALAAGWIWIGPEREVALVYDGTSYGMELRNALVLGVAVMAAIIALWSLLSWLWRLPRRVRSGLGLRRRNQALEAMEDALLAGAAGDVALARDKAARARKLVESPRLGHIVSAQALEAAGDQAEATAHYEALLTDPKAAPTAQRGLAQAALERGDYADAIEHAHLAFSQTPRARWAFDTLFRAQLAAGVYADALRTLGEGESRRHIDAESARRRRVVLETALASRWDAEGRAEEARDLAVAAATRDPEFAPAVALAARLLARVGETRRARKLIEAAWSRRPHPALGFAFRDVIEGTGEGWLGRFSQKTVDDLVALNPTHRESVLLEVEQAMASERWVEAWKRLSPLLASSTGDEPSARLCLMAARCEAGLGNPREARIWMERAATAPKEGDWSDLDPQGDAFAYTDADWQRLVLSYGERGELIHPRLEGNARTRLAVPVELEDMGKPEADPLGGAPTASAPLAKAKPPEAPSETLSKVPSETKGDLARRLDRLLPPKAAG